MMGFDISTLLRELDVEFAAGSMAGSWVLRTPDGVSVQRELTVPARRLDAAQIRMNGPGLRNGRDRLLHVGGSATAGVIERAEAGEIDLLIAEPTLLVLGGHRHELPAPWVPRQPPQHKGRAAWIRWALQRYLLIASAPARQPVIAATLGSTQQSVSRAAQALGGWVTDQGSGLFASDPQGLLEHWLSEYPGPGGQEFGWYGLATAAEHSDRVIRLAATLEVNALVSGDVAADRIAPWKLPSRARVYLTEPIDLADEGLVPVPLEEANLVTCVPRDPTIWPLARAIEDRSTIPGVPCADPVVVYWDLLMSGEQDSEEAAHQLAKSFLEHRPAGREA
ncbi:type IV toxin-antitoxin system AbiEi family antitoxin [Brachybacterium muris]|uniref:type IV toxin-antitoxin system AbiEi family antitoxin n=1 Tax=Brachybacterium muris TaxID=219301 RepID=UPI00223A7A95|nr:type IV toxin-antitoxin system AbiEi family antitoxin [Brachybacterium muris]MCT2295745.1 type IV toxin-antitoxin system AbiEi family antitoxin [Brachybacterium muris]